METSQSLKLVLNDKEIIAYLIDVFCKNRKVYNFSICNFSLSEGFAKHQKAVIQYEKSSNPKRWNSDKTLHSTTKQLKKSVEADLENWLRSVEETLQKRKEKYETFIKNNLEVVINKLGEEKIFEHYAASKSENFVKSIGLQLSNNYNFVRRKKFVDYNHNCLIRNTVGNEDLLLEKISKNLSFWFIDSGYTNFLETNKKWHRLVCNHLHHSDFLDVPCDRLGNFKVFPKPWRSAGEKILVIEPGPFSANIFNVDIKSWRYKIEEEIRQYSSRPIVFREKVAKKTRTSLYQHLLDEDYYCVININSNAATESVWAGIPVITLDKHITNPISTDKISNINNLRKPNIASWLAMLSYSQFTFDELIDGKAVKLIRRYHYG